MYDTIVINESNIRLAQIALKKSVEQKLSEGYKLQGGVSISYIDLLEEWVIAQAVIKE